MDRAARNSNVTKAPSFEVASHCHWLIWAYASRDGENFHDVTQLDVLGANFDEAMGKARILFQPSTGGGYVVRSIVEHFGLASCQTQH
jgi:hypothetical protein